MKKLTNTRFILNETHLIMENSVKKKSLDLNKIKKLRQDFTGMIISGTEGKIAIPKHLPDFNTFKIELEKIMSNKGK